VRRIQQALRPTQPPLISNQPSHVNAPISSATSPHTQPSPVVESASSTSSGRATPPSSNETQVQSLLADRASRLVAQKKKDDEEAKKRRSDKGKAKAEPSAVPEAQRKHVEQLRRKQSAAREERQRILQAIEDDKIARRAKQAEREAQRKAAAEGSEVKPEDEVPFAPASPLYATSGRITAHCALQVRLLDGSTIRSRFSSHDTLKDVRQWVDDTTTGDIGSGSKTPYIFKILLTPLPSKTVDFTEEGNALHDFGLTPSATLILVPARRSRSAALAYAAAPVGGNVFSRIIWYTLSLITGFVGVVLSFFSTLFSTSRPPQGPTQEPVHGEGPASGMDGSRIGARRVNEGRNDQQFYNGNSVSYLPYGCARSTTDQMQQTNFEPRPDDGEE